jgi:hypothetical protein
MWSLESLGWTKALTTEFEPHARLGRDAGRVAVVHKDLCGVYTPMG